ncbi:MAG: HAD-IA family hydrolase [Alphaproteobacteria bacterium]
MNPMIKAVVFDLGGVLFAEGKSMAVDRLAEEHGYERGVVSGVLNSDKAVELRRGLISDDQFWVWVQRQIPAGYDASLIKQAWYDGYVLDGDIRALIQSLRSKYKIIAFSGNIESRIHYLEEKYRFRHLFDLEIYSFDYHVTKPDKRFVEIMIEKAGCQPEQIAYVDDNERYAQPARELGVRVVIYQRGESAKLKSELNQLGIRL